LCGDFNSEIGDIGKSLGLEERSDEIASSLRS